MCDMNSDSDSDCSDNAPTQRGTGVQLITTYSTSTMSRSKTPAGKNEPVPGTSRCADNKQSISASATAPERKRRRDGGIVSPKKRPYVAPETHTDKLVPPLKIIISKQKDARKKVTPELSPDELQYKCVPTDDKSREPIAATSANKASVKSGRTGGKKQTHKASTSKATKEASSTSFNVETQSSDAPTAGTSASTTIKSADSNFWNKMAKNKFMSHEYKALLKTAFSERQSSALQELFSKTSRMLSGMFTNRNRCKKTHKCVDCEFSVTHECVPMNFTHFAGSTTAAFAPETTVTCRCYFAFFHSHQTKSHDKQVYTLDSKDLLQEHSRSASLNCRLCDTEVVLQNRHKQVCCGLNTWTGLNSDNHKQFHKSIETFMKNYSPKTLSFEELYSCSEGCCLLFHRCASDDVCV